MSCQHRSTRAGAGEWQRSCMRTLWGPAQNSAHPPSPPADAAAMICTPGDLTAPGVSCTPHLSLSFLGILSCLFVWEPTQPFCCTLKPGSTILTNRRQQQVDNYILPLSFSYKILGASVNGSSDGPLQPMVHSGDCLNNALLSSFPVPYPMQSIPKLNHLKASLHSLPLLS